MNQQLLLNLHLSDEATLDDFHWGNQLWLRQILEDILTQRNSTHFLYLFGASGHGKSHLLKACCQALSDNAIYLPLTLLKPYGPDVLENIEQLTLICIDDLHVIAGDDAWEEALFHLYNRIKSHEKSTLMMSANVPVAELPIKLQDLKSRLSWGLVLQLHDLPDEDKINTLQQHAAQKGFELSRSVAVFIISRCERNMHALDQVLNQLDELSLTEQRKITIPFVKRVLAL